MRHTGTVLLTTPRLLLRPFTEEDAPAAFHGWLSSPEATKYLSFRPHRDLGITKTVVDSWLKDYRKPHGYHWCVTLKETGEVIGGVDVVRSDEYLESAELGYCIAPAFWGNGFATEAAGAVLRHLIEVVGYRRICGRHDTRNPASGAVLKKIGMEFEGVARSAARDNNGEFCDVANYARVAHDRA